MATWDRADLHTRLIRALARPTTDGELPALSALGDELLGDAQREVAERLAMEAPESNYSTIALTTADNKLYSTASASVKWIGEIELYRDNTLRGLPMSLGAFWDPRCDFTQESERTVRICCGRVKNYPTLSARAFLEPGLLDGSNPPVLKPERLLKAVVFLAAANFCDRGSKRNPATFLRQYERAYNQTVTSMRSNQSTGVGGGRGWWNATGDLGRMG